MTYEMLMKLIAQSDLSVADKQALYSIDATNPGECLGLVRAKLFELSFESQLDKVRGQLAQLARQGKNDDPSAVLLQMLKEINFAALKAKLEELKKEDKLHGVGLHLLNLVDRVLNGKMVIKLGHRSLVEVWDSLDPAKIDGKAFVEDLRSEAVQFFAKKVRLLGMEAILVAERNKQNAYSDLAAILSDRVKINDALKAVAFIKIPASSPYYESEDFLGYITSQDFNLERDLGDEVRRVYAYLDVFSQAELHALGFTREAILGAKQITLMLIKAIVIANALQNLQNDYLMAIDPDPKNTTRLRLQLKLEVGQITENENEFAETQLKKMQTPINSARVLEGRLAEIDKTVSEFLQQYLPANESDAEFDAGGLFGPSKVDVNPRLRQLRQSGFVDVDDDPVAEELSFSDSMADEVDAEKGNDNGILVTQPARVEGPHKDQEPVPVAAPVNRSDSGKEEAGDEAPAVAEVLPQAPVPQVDSTVINNALLAVEALYQAKASKQITASQLKSNVNAIRELIDAVQSTLPKGAAGADLFLPRIIEVISPSLRGVHNGIFDYIDLYDVLSGIDGDKLKRIPDYDVMIVKDDNEMPQIGVALYAINQLSSAIRQVGKDARSEDLLNKLHNSELNLEEVTLMEAMDMLYFSINKGDAENKALLKQARKFGDDAHDHPDKAQDVISILNNVAEIEGLDQLSEDIVAPYLENCDQANQKCDTLRQACNEYLLHLGHDIYAAIRDDNFELCKQLVKPGDNGRPTFDVQGILNPSDENMDIIAGLRARNVSLNLAVEKYKAVSEMKSTLNAYDVPTHNLKNFEMKFSEKRALIETRRDSGAIKFLKAVASVLALVVSAFAGPLAGAALLNKLWKVKGEKKAKEIDQILDDAPKNNNPRK